MAANAGVPVVNALTDDYHPCQILADLLTVREHRAARRADPGLPRRRRQQHGPLLPAGRRTAGMHVRIGAPGRATCRTRPSSAGAEELAAADRRLACWSPTTPTRPSPAPTSSPPTPGSRWARRTDGRDRIAAVRAYAVTRRLLSRRRPDAIVLHCLPAYRGKEIAAEVIDGPQSVVWDEAENRLHAQKALLAFLARPAVTGSPALTSDQPAPGLTRTKTARQARIIELLGPQPVRSQAELADLLAPTASQVTQATLSRDLVELGAVRVRGTDGAPGLRRARRGRRPHAAGGRAREVFDARLARLCERAAGDRRGVGQPGGAAHAAGRRAVPGLGHRPRRSGRRPGHHRRRRHRPADHPRPAGRSARLAEPRSWHRLSRDRQTDRTSSRHRAHQTPSTDNKEHIVS